MIMIVSGLLFVSGSLASPSYSSSFAFTGGYGLISEWGSFGITSPGHFSHPQFIAVGEDGSVYVSDLGNKRVQKFSSSGQYITHWGKSGTQPGEFHYPSGIAVSKDSVFVADRDLNRIQKFSTDGQFISQWGEKGTYEGQFFFPNGIAVYNGTVFVADTGNQRIQKFTSDGEFLTSFGSSGLGEGEFLTIVGVETDETGHVYVSDKGNGKIEKFDSDGTFVKSIPFGSHNYRFAPEAIVVDPSGDMFIINSANDRILHLPQVANTRLGIFDQSGPYPNSFAVVTDMAIGINGELLVVDSSRHRIQSYGTPFYVVPDSLITDEEETDDSINDDDIMAAEDGLKPVITAPVSLVVEATDFKTFVSIGQANATDSGGIKAIINNAPDGFGPGVSTIVWIAFDHSGYSSSVMQTVTVKTCGKVYSDYNQIIGTAGDDVLQGTDGDDLIFGLSGNDLISGGQGRDCIFGGDGDDVVFGGDGGDVLMGNSGHDILKGQSGVDIIHAGPGSDVVDGGSGTDRCYSDSAADLLLRCEG